MQPPKTLRISRDAKSEEETVNTRRTSREIKGSIEGKIERLHLILDQGVRCIDEKLMKTHDIPFPLENFLSSLGVSSINDPLLSVAVLFKFQIYVGISKF